MHSDEACLIGYMVMFHMKRIPRYALFYSIFLLTACDNELLPVTSLPSHRTVATTYEIQSEQANCHQLPRAKSRVMATLKRKQLVDLVSLETRLIPESDRLWLHVYPRLNHRYSCYLNTQDLIPLARSS